MDFKTQQNQGVVIIPVIPALKRPREKDYEFKASLGCVVNPRPAWTKWEEPVSVLPPPKKKTSAKT
jgi:hypothetical protein